MSESQQSFISDEERERMQRFAEQLQETGRPNASVLEPEPNTDELDKRAEWKGVFRVSERICESIKERVSDGETYTSVADDFDVSERVARYHAHGECKHDHDVVIDPERCAAIREMARDGLTYPEINNWVGASTASTVRQHAVGDCTCGRYHDVPAYDVNRAPNRSEDATPHQCARWRQRARNGESPREISESRGVEHTGNRIRHHIYGRCACEHDTPKLPPSDARPKSNHDLCAEWRRRVRREDETSPNSISNEDGTDFSSKAISHHVYGRCVCDHHVDPVSKDEVGKRGVKTTECSEWRARARIGSESAAAISRDPSVDWGAKTVAKHVYGRCDCDHDTPPAEK